MTYDATSRTPTYDLQRRRLVRLLYQVLSWQNIEPKHVEWLVEDALLAGSDEPPLDSRSREEQAEALADRLLVSLEGFARDATQVDPTDMLNSLVGHGDLRCERGRRHETDMRTFWREASPKELRRPDSGRVTSDGRCKFFQRIRNFFRRTT